VNEKAGTTPGTLVVFAVNSSESAADMSLAVFGARAPGHTWIEDQFSNGRGSGTTVVLPGDVITQYPNEFLVAADGVGTTTIGYPLPPWNSEPVDGLGGVQSYYVASSIQSSVSPSYGQSPSSAWCLQLGTFAAK
jgi:hypothetical protein